MDSPSQKPYEGLLRDIDMPSSSKKASHTKQDTQRKKSFHNK